ncbi:MAG: hypothetical protein D4R40_01905, partial [Nitrosomonadaceae bacterium]
IGAVISREFGAHNTWTVKNNMTIGKIYLLDTGTGDVELVTLKVVCLLSKADVVGIAVSLSTNAAIEKRS